MVGAIIGDIIGSEFERDGLKEYDFSMFSPACSVTDDSVLTIATAESLLGKGDYEKLYRIYGATYPNAGYGGTFKKWVVQSDFGPYNSWGNGSAMRVSPVAYAKDTLEEVLLEARKSAEVTHNHPEGIKGAQAIAATIFMARKGHSKEEIKKYAATEFQYLLEGTVDQIRPMYRFDVSCQGSVPQSILCFLESTDFESAVRLAVSLGGDTDTMACMAGAIAEAYYGEIPNSILEKAVKFIPKEFVQSIRNFEKIYDLPVTI